jgi:hypothetical protein
LRERARVRVRAKSALTTLTSILSLKEGEEARVDIDSRF